MRSSYHIGPSNDYHVLLSLEHLPTSRPLFSLMVTGDQGFAQAYFNLSARLIL